MSTWWRIAKDSNGLTVVDRLEIDHSHDPESQYDDEGNVLPYVPSTCYQRSKRIRSILRRLKGCVKCHGTGKVPALEERGGPWMEYQVLVYDECDDCNGTGRRIRSDG